MINTNDVEYVLGKLTQAIEVGAQKLEPVATELVTQYQRTAYAPLAISFFWGLVWLVVTVVGIFMVKNHDKFFDDEGDPTKKFFGVGLTATGLFSLLLITGDNPSLIKNINKVIAPMISIIQEFKQ